MQNLFKYATRELSQDAILKCILSEKNSASEELIRRMADISGPFTIEEVKTEKNIDILVTILRENKKEAIIIEDKTDTFLHDLQSIKYISSLIQQTSTGQYKYGHIHFVLFKTGVVPFWEMDYYDLEARICLNPTTYRSQKVLFYNDQATLEKSLQAIQIYLKRSGIITYHRPFLYGDFEQYLDSNQQLPNYSWLSDYKAYFKGAKDEEYWLNKYYKDVKSLSNGLVGNSSIYSGLQICIMRPSSGGGKKNYEIRFEGICGKQAANRQISAPSVHENYYILPTVVIDDKNSTFKLSIQFHLFMNEKERVGYQKSNGRGSLDPAIKDAQAIMVNTFSNSFGRQGWRVKKIKDDTLKLFTKSFNKDKMWSVDAKNQRTLNHQYIQQEVDFMISKALDMGRELQKLDY